MTDPGSIANAFPREGLDAVWDEIRKLHESVRQLQTAKVGNRMTVDGAPGITVKGGGSIVIQDGGGLSIDDGGDIALVGGDLVASGGELLSGNFDHGDAGWRLQPGGNAEFNNITLRGGIIGNDDLTDPIVPAAPHADATGFSINATAFTVPALATVPVPDGYSRALVIAVAQACGYDNETAGADGLYVAVRIDGTVPPGWAAQSVASNSELTTATAAGSSLLTGLGASFTIGCAVKTAFDHWTDGAANTANIDATVLFLR